MRAAILPKYGPAAELQVQSVETPTPSPNQVLVKIHASSINPIDWKIRNGFFVLRLIFGFMRPRNHILGIDFSGEIIELGSAITKFKLQDQVIGATIGGAHAEYICVEESKLAYKPQSMSFQESAGVPLAGLTALQALRDKGNIGPDQNILIYGASGGVGTFAVQLGNYWGSNITGVCSTPSIPLVKSLGAKTVIDRTNLDQQLSKNQYDIIFDAAGHGSYGTFKKFLTPNGIYIASTPHMRDFLPLLLTIVRRKKAKTLIARLDGQDLAIISKQIEEGQVRTIIDSIYQLEDIASAHLHAEQGHSKGKVIVQIANE